MTVPTGYITANNISVADNHFHWLYHFTNISVVDDSSHRFLLLLVTSIILVDDSFLLQGFNTWRNIRDIHINNIVGTPQLSALLINQWCKSAGLNRMPDNFVVCFQEFIKYVLGKDGTPKPLDWVVGKQRNA